MLDYWEGEARADGISEEIIQAVLQRLQSYGKLTPESRAESLKGLWNRIGDSVSRSDQKADTRASFPAPACNHAPPAGTIPAPSLFPPI